jgi:hypothetical protein
LHIRKTVQTLDPAKQVFILTPQHQLVGEGMFYTQGKIPFFQWDAPLRINNLSSQNAPPPGSEAVYFSEGEGNPPSGILALFESCERSDPLVLKRREVPFRTHPFWKCKGFKGIQ